MVPSVTQTPISSNVLCTLRVRDLARYGWPVVLSWQQSRFEALILRLSVADSWQRPVR